MTALNSFAEQWWVYVFHATWQAALVAAVALALVTVFRRIPAPWRYALLLVALAKFVAPPAIDARIGVFRWAGPVVAVHDSRVAVQSFNATAPAVVRQPPVEAIAANPGHPPSLISDFKSQITAISWLSWLMLLHAAGMLAGLAWIARGLWNLLRLTRRAEPITRGPLHERFTALAKRLELRDGADLLVTDAPVPPVAYWLLRAKVMLPRPLLQTLSAQQLDTILIHELLHHRRNDWSANLAQLVILAAWWFNPLAWLLHRALSRTREECCDDALLAENLTTPDGYTQTLLTAARQLTHQPPLGATLAFAERLHPLGNRVKRILDPALKHYPKLSPGGLVVVGILGLAVLPGLKTTTSHAAVESPRPIEGWVVTPEGKPVANVAVKLVETGGIVSFVRDRSLSDRGHVSAATDAAGRFVVTPQSNTWMIVFDHDAGFAKVDSNNLPPTRIVLKPWGRITGTLRIGSQPAVNEIMSCHTMDRLEDRGPFAHYSYEATTDEVGKFVFNRVRPGDVYLGRNVQVSERGWISETRLKATVGAGETVEVVIGGEGRPVIGKLIAPEGVEIANVYSSFGPTLKFRQATGQFGSLAAEVESDGRFRIEDVPGGIYSLTIEIYNHERGTTFANRPNFVAAKGTREDIVVPVVQGGGVGEAVDIGEIQLVRPQVPEEIGKEDAE